MILLARLVAQVGWRGVLGLIAGAAMATVPAYHIGTWIERLVGEERTQRALAERDIQRMEQENAKVVAAAAARARAAASGADRDGGVSDDGFRRD